MTNPTVHSWDAPDESLIEDRRGELPAFPIDALPTAVAAWLQRASRGAGTLLDHVAVPMIGATSSLIGKARMIRASTSWSEPTTLWTCVVAQSGDRKTPGLRTVTRALDEIERENAPTYLAANAKHQARAERARAELKRWRKAYADAIAAKREPPPMPISAVDPGDFIHPALHVSDSTVQRLAKLCQVRPRGMLQIRDELAALFTGMRSSGSRAFYLESWNGGKFTVERVAENSSFTVENLLVGLTGGFQPDRLARAFAGDEDGLSSRFLYGWPATPSYNPLNDDIGEVDLEFKSWLTKLIRLPAEDANGAFAPRTIPLSAAAREVFEDYRRFVDKTKRSIDGLEAQWLAKSETNTLRLTIALAYLDWASISTSAGLESIVEGLEPTTIGQRSMINATTLMREYFWVHARAALRQVGLSDRHGDIRKILRWIRANDRHEVALIDIRRSALGGKVDVEQARALADRLVAAGWLRPEEVIRTGGRPRERWIVNPKLSPAETAQTAQSRLSAVPAVSAGSKTRGK